MASRYTEVRKIGAGSFGSAHLARVVASPDDFVVIKRVDLTGLGEAELRAARREAGLLAHLKHPAVLAHIESYEADGALHMVTEHCARGDLAGYIAARKEPVAEERALGLATEAGLALLYLHSKKILHRDLKPANLFLAADGSVRVGDFGIARVLKHTMELAKTVVGTPYYLSPEVCEAKPYNHKSDVWSLGCILYELLSLRHAFEATSISALVRKIVKGTTSGALAASDDTAAVVARCLQATPAARPSMAQLLAMPVLQPHVRAYVARCARRGLSVPGVDAIAAAAAGNPSSGPSNPQSAAGFASAPPRASTGAGALPEVPDARAAPAPVAPRRQATAVPAPRPLTPRLPAVGDFSTPPESVRLAKVHQASLQAAVAASAVPSQSSSRRGNSPRPASPQRSTEVVAPAPPPSRVASSVIGGHGAIAPTSSSAASAQAAPVQAPKRASASSAASWDAPMATRAPASEPEPALMQGRVVPVVDLRSAVLPPTCTSARPKAAVLRDPLFKVELPIALEPAAAALAPMRPPQRVSGALPAGRRAILSLANAGAPPAPRASVAELVAVAAGAGTSSGAAVPSVGAGLGQNAEVDITRACMGVCSADNMSAAALASLTLGLTPSRVRKAARAGIVPAPLPEPQPPPATGGFVRSEPLWQLPEDASASNNETVERLKLKVSPVEPARVEALRGALTVILGEAAFLAAYRAAAGRGANTVGSASKSAATAAAAAVAAAAPAASSDDAATACSLLQELLAVEAQAFEATAAPQRLRR